MPGPLPKKGGAMRKKDRSVAMQPAEDLSHVPERWHRLPSARPRVLERWLPGLDGPVLVGKYENFNDATVEWWFEIVHSQMAREFMAVDWHGLFRLAVLVDDYWWLGDTKLLPEIRQAQQAFGLTPIDRRRLQWEAAKASRADSQRRSSSSEPVKAAPKKRDPRLRLVKSG
jgi:hypothetical protein